jgi:CRISPR-associated endonuclease Cas1
MNSRQPSTKKIQAHSGLYSSKELKPEHGVISLSGYGIAVRADRGHLYIEDGVGTDRRKIRLSRINHGLTRLVIIGCDGYVSLAALRWLSDQRVSFMMLDRDGTVMATTGASRPFDAKVRRAQALSQQNGEAFRISRELIDRKLAGQQKVAIQSLGNEAAGIEIRRCRSELAEVESLDAVRQVEAKAARIYWSAWSAASVSFPRKELSRIPWHWLTFGTRKSSLSGSPRLATNPLNAMLNYLYALLESECRLAASALGLDPGIGVLHLDTPGRDSLACDLMEVVRPEVDAFVLNWIRRGPLSRNYFFEQRDGNCRLMGPFAAQLSQSAPTWARLVAPVAEWFAQEISRPKTSKPRVFPTRLTHQNRRAVRSNSPAPVGNRGPTPIKLCRLCGAQIKSKSGTCVTCSKPIHTSRLTKAAHIGRVASHAAKSEAKRASTQQRNLRAIWDWKPTDRPSWLTEKYYSEKIQPVLSVKSGRSIAKLLGVSCGYAGHIRKGKVPHPRHWEALLEFTKS